MRARLETLGFECLAGWNDDDHLAALRAFQRSARTLATGRESARPAPPAPPELIAPARAAHCESLLTDRGARLFFETRFQPFRVIPDDGAGFLTGYYEP